MTEVDAPALASEMKPVRVAPRAVIVAFWLWWPPLVAQAIVLVLMVIAFVAS